MKLGTSNEQPCHIPNLQLKRDLENSPFGHEPCKATLCSCSQLTQGKIEVALFSVAFVIAMEWCQCFFRTGTGIVTNQTLASWKRFSKSRENGLFESSDVIGGSWTSHCGADEPEFVITNSLDVDSAGSAMSAVMCFGWGCTSCSLCFAEGTMIFVSDPSTQPAQPHILSDVLTDLKPSAVIDCCLSVRGRSKAS